MTVCESDSGLCWDLDEETLARAILTFCLNTADALMTALLKGTADAWEALTLIRDSDPELRTSAGAGKVIEQAFCIGMTRWGSKPTPQAVRSFRSALATWQQRLRTLPTWDRDYLCGWFTMEGRQWIIAPHDVWWPTRLNDLALLGRCAPPLCLWGQWRSRGIDQLPAGRRHRGLARRQRVWAPTDDGHSRACRASWASGGFRGSHGGGRRRP